MYCTFWSLHRESHMFHFGVINIYAKYICIYNYIYIQSWVMSHIIRIYIWHHLTIIEFVTCKTTSPPDGLTHWFGIQDAELLKVSQQQVRRYHVSTVYREAKLTWHEQRWTNWGEGGRWWHINLPLSHSSEASSSEVYAQSQLGSLPCDKIQVNHEKTSIFHRFIRLDGGLTKQYYT